MSASASRQWITTARLVRRDNSRWRTKYSSCTANGVLSQWRSNPVSPMPTTRSPSAKAITSFQAVGPASMMLLGWMPTVAKISGREAAIDTQTALEGAVVATAIMVPTPAARARARTAGRSAANCSASRCAWVSMREATLRQTCLRLRRDQCFELEQMLPFHRQQFLDFGPYSRIFQRGQIALQVSNRLALMLDKHRHHIVEGEKIDGREVGGVRGQVRQPNALAEHVLPQTDHRLSLGGDEMLERGQRFGFGRSSPGKRLGHVLKDRAPLTAENVLKQHLRL